MPDFIKELCSTFLLLVGIFILLGGFFEAIRKVLGEEKRRRPQKETWELWLR